MGRVFLPSSPSLPVTHPCTHSGFISLWKSVAQLKIHQSPQLLKISRLFIHDFYSLFLCVSSQISSFPLSLILTNPGVQDQWGLTRDTPSPRSLKLHFSFMRSLPGLSSPFPLFWVFLYLLVSCEITAFVKTPCAKQTSACVFICVCHLSALHLGTFYI